MPQVVRHHIEHTVIDDKGNKYILYPKNTLKDVHTSEKSGETIQNKITFSGKCTTDAATAAKTVNIPGFSLIANTHLTVTFTNAITVANATLSVNSGAAKPIMYKGARLLADAIPANSTVLMVYDGTNFNIIGAQDGARLAKNTTTKFFLIGTSTDKAQSPSQLLYDTGVYVSATDGQLVAKSFSGNGASLTNLNASQVKSGTLAKERLATSGVTAGNYGPTANATPAYNATFNVPYFTVDGYGRVTAAATRTVKIPASDNSDTKVKSTMATTTKFYLVGTTSSTTATGELYHDTGIYTDTTAGKLYATTFQGTTYYLGGTSAYVNKDNYTGTAAKVKTISGFLVDSVASANANGITNKALTANQGYLLQNQINTLNSNLSKYVKNNEYFTTLRCDATNVSGAEWLIGYNTDGLHFGGVYTGQSFIKGNSFILQNGGDICVPHGVEYGTEGGHGKAGMIYSENGKLWLVLYNPTRYISFDNLYNKMNRL